MPLPHTYTDTYTQTSRRPIYRFDAIFIPNGDISYGEFFFFFVSSQDGTDNS